MNQTANGRGRPATMTCPPPLGLSRYGSAPGSILAGMADSVIGGGRDDHGDLPAPPAPVASDAMLTRFFSGDSPCRAGGRVPHRVPYGSAAELHLSGGGGGGAGFPLVRHSSLPSGFFSHLLSDHGVSATRTVGNYPQSQAGTEGIHVLGNRRLRTQWSFSRQDSLSQISEMSIEEEIEESATCHDNSDEGAGHPVQSYISGNFPLSSWDENNSIEFSAPPHKRTKGNVDSKFSLPRSSSEMSELDKYLQIRKDSVPCRVRAKRGCATHPRSIAERERRTRISKRLQKLQDLVPNMDKQTSTSDMLEFAIQHIKELQNQVQKLKQEQASCTCSGKK